jgi:hypothetical protein
MARIDELLERQAKELDELDDAAARRVMAAYEDARRELRENVESLLANAPDNLYTIEQMTGTLAQVDGGVRRLTSRLGIALGEQAAVVQAAAGRHLVELVRAAEPSWGAAVVQVEAGLVARLSSPTATALRHSRTLAYGSELAAKVQASAVQAAAQKLTITQTVDRLTAQTGEVFAGAAGRSRAFLHTRMQLNTSYNEGHREGVTRLSERLDLGRAADDPLLMRISEYRDKRTSAISIVLDGMTKPVADADGNPVQWRVSKAAVLSAAAANNASASGIVWREDGGFYVGDGLPAHYNERGREHAWRASWAKD